MLSSDGFQGVNMAENKTNFKEVSRLFCWCGPGFESHHFWFHFLSAFKHDYMAQMAPVPMRSSLCLTRIEWMNGIWYLDSIWVFEGSLLPFHNINFIPLILQTLRFVIPTTKGNFFKVFFHFFHFYLVLKLDVASSSCSSSVNDWWLFSPLSTKNGTKAPDPNQWF